MIFNCANCCKTISSAGETCPYCLVQLQNVVDEMSIAPLREKRAMFKFMAKKKIAQVHRVTRHVTKTATKVATHHVTERAPETITHIVNGLKTAKPHHM